jgi:hypothetical protein
MTITIKPFTVNLGDKSIAYLLNHGKDESPVSVVYWGSILNNEQISYTSTKALAEKTKLWIEKWLNNNLELATF